MNSDFSGAGHIRLDNKDRVCERIQEKEDIVRLEVCERERGVILEEIRGKRDINVINEREK